MHTRPLVAILAEVVDPRQARGVRYSCTVLLVIACVAMLSGAQGYSAMAEWGRNYGQTWFQACGVTRANPPCAGTFRYLFTRLDRHRLEQTLQTWVESIIAEHPLSDQEMEQIAIDGKTLRGSHKQHAPGTHILSALATRLGLTVMQRAVDDKTNEIGEIQALLKDLVLAGRVFTMDALLTQRAVAETIVKGGGDYVMVVKKNQKQLRDDIAHLFQIKTPWTKKKIAFHTIERGHGRQEYRCLIVSDIIAGYPDWPGAKQVLRIERSTWLPKKNKQRVEVVYGITSLSVEEASPETLLSLVRHHWLIENLVHWVRDVTFKEDLSTVRVGSTPQVMAALRNTVMGLLRSSGYAKIAAACRYFAAQPGAALALIGLAPAI